MSVAKNPKPNHQTPGNHQIPSFNPVNPTEGSEANKGSSLVFGFWSFPGAWNLGFGASAVIAFFL
jgi:hypothetical protein